MQSAVFGKFNAEAQAVAPDQAAVPVRPAIARQEQNELRRQLHIALKMEPRSAMRNVGDRAGDLGIVIFHDFCVVMKAAPRLFAQFCVITIISRGDHRISPSRSGGEAA
ncbi:MAG: hypothetical protein WBD71_20155 [Xanthobacteraceae bacterium]